MRRLIRHLIFIAGATVLLPAIALAQVISNSATGELNALSLDLSQATVTLNRTTLVDPNNSTVTVDPPIVMADGIAFSTITVTLRDGNNLPIAGRVVSLASSRGALDVVTQPLNPTDANGVTTGEIRSTTNGATQIMATDVASGVLLNDQPQVLFTFGEVLQLTKTVSPDRATVGDVVTYSVAIANTTTNTLSMVRILDEASPVLTYLPGTARLDGAAIPDPLPGPPMEFDVGDIDPLADANGNGVADPGEGGYHILSYSMIVGAGARVGSYGNLAVAVDVCDSCTLSTPVSVDLEITADPIFDLGTVIGKVFHDLDADGRQDRGETGISGAMVALDSGTYALTDAHGRYHFPAIKPGQRMVKLNIHSIAGNARAVGGDKKVLSVTPGLLATATFAVTYGFETEEIGRDGEFGAGLESFADKLPDRISGSPSNLSAVVNGIPLAFAGVNVTLLDADANDIIHLAEAGKVEPLRFVLDGTVPDRAVDQWTLRIWREQDTVVKSIRGQGELPGRVEWDDIDEIQRLLQPGFVYFYQLEIEEPNMRATSSRGMFGVNRNTAVMLRLSGGAFVVGSAVLTGQAMNLLGETAEIMRTHPDEIVQINGHTDSSGSSEYNQRLSEQRAKAAFDYLVKFEDISPNRFVVRGFGEDQPIASNDSEAGRRMNRRVEIVGELTEVERSRLYATQTNALRAVMNGETMELGTHGQFSDVIDGPGMDMVDLQLTDEIGRGIDTTIALPLLQVMKPAGTEFRPFAAGQSWTREAGLVPPDLSYDYRLIGRTDIGNYVELDRRPLEVDESGRFESQLTLTAGRNAFVLSARNAKGFVRYANVQITVKTNNDGVPIVAVEPIPKLVLQLPPKGVPMRSANLVVPGYTDPGNMVRINGQPVEVDQTGHFFTRMPLDPGINTIVTVVTDSDGFTGGITRDIEYAGDALFIMALADGKVSQIRRKGNLQAAGADSANEVRTDGRVALYLKGTVRGRYLISAAFDSGSSEIGELFSELDAIENERLVTNIDPDTIYPVYGDDSTLVYDTESQGKLYLGLEGEQLNAVVGNYKLNFTDTELTAYQRTLYGTHAGWHSRAETTDNESVTEAEVFVAQVDQVPVRDQIVATGGSLYFLSQTDIIEGSEQVSLLVHDQRTGLLLQRISQQREADYDIKYREGRIWFTRPISTVISDGTLIGSNLLAGNPVTIQVDYETRVDGLEAGISGGRFKQRLANGRFSIGGLHVEDDGGSGPYALDGVDVEIELETARIVAEYAQSEGTDSMVFRSVDGGLQFSPVSAGAAQDGAAYKLAAEFDAGAWFGSPGRLLGSAYYKDLDAGFIANGNFALADNRQYGAVLNYKLNDLNSVLLRVDDQLQGQTTSSTQTTLNWRHTRDRLVLEGEYFDRQVDGAVTSGSAAALRAQYAWTNSLTASLEHQQSISGATGTQSAAGLEYAFKQKLRVSGRVVTGPDGEAFQGGASWDTSFGRLYARQQLTGPESSDDSASTVLGAEAPFGAGGTVYTEYQWDRSGERRGLRSITGIRRDWSMTRGLSLLLSGEQTTLQAPGGTENKLNALVGGASFDRKGLKLSTRNEWRRQRGLTSLDQFLTLNHGELKLPSGFTLLGEYRQSKSDDLMQPDQSTDFQEASVGFAVRPIEHDRWNVLFKLSRLDSDATPAQVDTRYDDSTADLVSTDWSVQLHRNIEWVGKQAFRKKLTEPAGLAGIETNTSLSIQRLNFEIPWNLSIGTEYRRLYQKEADDQRSGFLGELMWNRFEHVGLGLGYNFTDFSSDLRFDSDYSEYGWFLRIQGRY
ncbi:MAG: OmpA family protein [Woeseia sp.]